MHLKLPKAATPWLRTLSLARIDDHLQQLLNGHRLDAHGLQTLQRELNIDMQDYLRDIVAFQNSARLNGDRLFPIQFAPPPDGNVHAIFTERTEKAAFLGVVTSPVSAILHEQLDIPRGMALVVDYIEKDSPAAAAGLKVHDILQKLDDQLLVNPQQLAVLVRSKKPGDSLSIAFLRGGKQTVVTAKLGEKELPLLEDMARAGDIHQSEHHAVKPIEYAHAGRTGNFVIPPHSSNISVHIDKDGSQTRTLVDDQNDISLSSKPDGTATLVVKDRAGHTLYEGPADKADLPPEVQAKVDNLRKRSNTVTMRSNGAEIHADAITLTRSDEDHVITLRVDARTGVR